MIVKVANCPTQDEEPSMIAQAFNHDGPAEAPLPLSTLFSSVKEECVYDLQAFTLVEADSSRIEVNV